MAERKIPLRKCIGCNEMKDKRELVRIVRNKEGEISVDLTGKKPGRGGCKGSGKCGTTEKTPGDGRRGGAVCGCSWWRTKRQFAMP